MNCTGKRCIMQFDKVDPATCKCVSYCPQATPPKTNADRNEKEYVKIEIGAFYHFVDFLSLLVDWSVRDRDDNTCLQSMIRDFENEVIRSEETLL